MRKTELKGREGEAFAVSDTGTYAEWERMRFVLVEVDGVRRLDNGAEMQGIVMRPDPPLPSDFRLPYEVRGRKVGQEYVLPNARYIHCAWEPYAENLRRHEAARAAARADSRRRHDLLMKAAAALRDAFGINPFKAGSGASLNESARFLNLALDAEVAEELFRRFEPMGIAGSAIEAFVEELHRAGLLFEALNPDIELARTVALAKMQQGLAVTDAELKARG